MPPPIEKYQNCRGTTLCFLRSDAIHCTRKRAEKSAWPSRPTPIHSCSVVMRGEPFVTGWLGRLAEHRPQHVVGLADVLGTPPAGDEREDLFCFLAGDRLLLVRADVGQVAQRHLERDRHAVEAVDRDRLLTALDLADELAA